MKRILLFIVFFYSSVIVFSQEFSKFSDTLSYPNDVVLLINTVLSNDDEYTITQLRERWKNNYFTDEEKGLIMNVSRIWFDRKAVGIHYLNLVNFLFSIKDSEKNRAYTIPFLKFFSKYISSKRTTLSNSNGLLLTYMNLIKSNYIYKSNATQWQYSGGNYELVSDTAKLYFSFSKGTVTCYSKHDSIQIFETTGRFYPLENKWEGKGGLVTWERAGFSREDVRVDLKTYNLLLNKNEYTADSATLYYKKYFSYPVLGVLNEKVMQVTSKENVSYPEFDSYNKRFLLKNLYENVDYDGGFTIKGARIIGSGNEKEDAKIIISQAGKVLMVAKSKYFVFRPNRINGLNSSIKINIETDSIYHSDLTFYYYPDKKEVNLQRSENFSSKSPYFNSYHKVDMDFDQLTWRINQPIINLSMARGASIGRARFESQSYYNQLEFEELQGRSDDHPLVLIRKFAKNNTNEFYASAFADYMGRPLEQVRQLIMYLAEKGFVFYNSETDIVKVKERLYQNLKASGGTIDYDVIEFQSLVNAPKDNATLNMENYDLLVNGTPRVAVSDSQNVIIYPANDQILLKKNRSFQFDGKIEAGLFTFYGRNFFFNYEEFKINLQSVDEVAVKVNTGELDNYGRPVTRDIKNPIKHVTGELLIDKSTNKAGLKSNPEFPIFTSRENAHVYYQYPDIEGGVYSEESFYYEVYPFTLDSLDNFRKEGLTFKGKFHSADILPDIEQELKVQPDYSFGFKFDPGQGGIPVYKGKGTLFGKLDLSTKGLRADGKLNYLTSTTLSKDFKFYPDSMNTQSSDFSMVQQTSGTQFPKVNANDNYIHWDTRFDAMYIKMGSGPFKMFNNETTLGGSLVLEPKGLSGKGTMDLTTADINSKLFTYRANEINADTSSFYLKSLHKKDYTVKTDNVKSHIDFVARNGDFTSNEDFSLVTFPENQYISYLDYFKWNMNDKTLEMGAKRSPTQVKKGAKTKIVADVDSTTNAYDRFRFKEEPIGPRYISINNKQDSLNFVAPLAIYDYDKNLLNASGVKLIRVADAIIYPSDGKVTISENAQMKTIFKTKIVAGYENKHHTIHTADVNIFGRFSFTGRGKYDYKDERDSIQVVEMKEIRVDTGQYTVAMGNIIESDRFTLSPDFAYQGKLNLHSQRVLPTFDGGVTLITECEKPKFHWLRFKSEIDPKNIFIPVDAEPKNINGGDMFNGIFIANDSIHVYPAFLSGRRNYNDKFIVTSSGFLRYNKDSASYEIASKDKLMNYDMAGNYLKYNKSNCIEFGEGKVDLGVNLGQVKLNSFGTASFNTNNKDVNLDILLQINFLFDANAITQMANKIDSFPDLTGMDFTRPLTIRMQNEILGNTTRADKYREEITMSGLVKEMPVEMMHTLNLTYLKLKWNHQTRSYQSVGKIGVGNIFNTHINKMVEGFIEITKRRSGDYMDIYLKLDSKNFYYFGYTRGVMQAYSSDTKFTNFVRDLSIGQRQMDVPRGETTYIYMVSSDSRMRNFLRNYQLYQKGEATQDMPDDAPEELVLPGATETKPDAKVKPGVNLPKKEDTDKKTEEKKDEKKEEKEVEVIEVQ